MEVVIWQLIVIVSVSLSYLTKGRKAALAVCLTWTAWTVFVIFLLPLVFMQLVFCWGTFFVCDWIARLSSTLRGKNREIVELQRHVESVLNSSTVSERQSDVLKQALSSTRESLQIVSGTEHFDVLKIALKDAKASLCILSGWIGSPLLDPDLQRLIRRAVSNEVRIHLGFGWESSAGHAMNATALGAMSFLRTLNQSRVIVAQFANHEKVLVVDESYCVIGSNNWLSNSSFRNSERSVLVRIPSFAAEEARRVRAIVEKYRK